MLRTVLCTLAAVLFSGCASSNRGPPVPEGGLSTWSGTLLFTVLDTRLYLHRGKVESNDDKHCAEINPQDDSLREQMERLQNARVRIQSAGPGDSSHCRYGITVASISDIENLSAPKAFEPQDLAGHVPQANISHADDIRRFALEVMRSIAAADYEGFRRLQLLDPVTESIMARTHNDFAKRRFTFMTRHQKEFFGKALTSEAPQVIVRQIEGRRTVSACICRRSTQCKESEGFDAPRLGSWGDAMFCFKLFYDKENEEDEYSPSRWRVSDPIFG